MIVIRYPLSRRIWLIIGRPRELRQSVVQHLLSQHWTDQLLEHGVRAWVGVGPACPGVNRNEMPAQFRSIERALRAVLMRMR
jgi:hypothetical protein